MMRSVALNRTGLRDNPSLSLYFFHYAVRFPSLLYLCQLESTTESYSKLRIHVAGISFENLFKKLC